MKDITKLAAEYAHKNADTARKLAAAFATLPAPPSRLDRLTQLRDERSRGVRVELPDCSLETGYVVGRIDADELCQLKADQESDFAAR